MAEIIIPSSSSSIIPSVDPNQTTEVNLPFHIIKLLDESHPIIHKEPVHWQFGINPDPKSCLLYTSPSPRDVEESRMPSSA